MKNSEIEKRIEELVQLKKELDEVYENLYTLTNLSPESKLVSVMYKPLDKYMILLQECINDNVGWINWFVWDNNCGERGLEAGYTGNMKPIKTVNDLIMLIKEKGE